METNRDNGRTINTALIQKDRADKLNGHEISMPSYAKLYTARPEHRGEHFDSMDKRDGKSLFQSRAAGTLKAIARSLV
jgi:hypothetical protein